MKLRYFPLYTDENIAPAVVAFLRSERMDVLDTCENGWQGTDDAAQLRLAWAQGRVVVTHDGDFGGLAVQAGEPFIGIVYRRPGHSDPSVTIASLQALIRLAPELAPGFLLVARRSGDDLSVRVRQVGA